MNKSHELFNKFYNYLYSKNIKMNKDDENEYTWSFSMNKLNFLFIYSASDPYYFKISLPKILIATDNRDKLFELINTLNMRYKVIKSYIYDDDLWISFESFSYSNKDINLLFDRAIKIMQEYFDTIKINMKN